MVTENSHFESIVKSSIPEKQKLLLYHVSEAFAVCGCSKDSKYAFG